MAAAILGNGLTSAVSLKSNLVVALAAFWANFCLLGVLRSNAVIYTALVDNFGVNREYAAWPSGIFGFFMCITGAISGFLSHHISIRNLAVFGAALASISVSVCCYATQMTHILIFYGAFQGIGVGMIVPLTHVVLNLNFTKYRALALGIAYSGSSLGSFIFPPISNILLSTYGLQGTFLLLGGIMLNSLLGALFFKTPRKVKLQLAKQLVEMRSPVERISYIEIHTKEGKNEDNCQISDKCRNKEICKITVVEKRNPSLEQNYNPTTVPKKEFGENFPNSKVKTVYHSMPTVSLAMEVLCSPAFIIVSISYASYFSLSAIFLMVIVDFAQDRGLSPDMSVFLVSAFSIGDLGGRLCCGWIADLQCVRRSTLVRFYLLTMGSLMAVVPACSHAALSAVAVVLGVLNGGVIVNHSVLLNEYLGLQKLPVAMGFSTCFVGLTAFLRPVIIGLFRDRNESYDRLFIFLGLLQIFITAVWFLEVCKPLLQRRLHTVNKTVQ